MEMKREICTKCKHCLSCRPGMGGNLGYKLKLNV